MTVQEGTVVDLDHLAATGEVVRVTETHTREHIEETEEKTTTDREVKQRVTDFAGGVEEEVEEKPATVTPPPGAYWGGYPTFKPTYQAAMPPASYPAADDGVTPLPRPEFEPGPNGEELSAGEKRRARKRRRDQWKRIEAGEGSGWVSALTFGPIVVLMIALWLLVTLSLAVWAGGIAQGVLMFVAAVGAGTIGSWGVRANTH